MTKPQAALLTMTLAAAAYGVFLLVGGTHDAGRLLQRVGLAGGAFILSLSLLNYLLRFLRWNSYCRRLGHRIALPLGFEYYLAGFGLTATPGKVGEAVRGVYLKKHGVPYPDSLSMVLAERVSDLIAMVLLSGFAVAILPGSALRAAVIVSGLLLVGIIITLATGNTGVVSSLQRRLAGRRLPKVQAAARQLLATMGLAGKLLRGPALLSGIALGLVSWGAEGVGFYYILGFLHAHIALDRAVGIYAVSVLLGALSFLPGGLGTTEASMVLLLVFSGVDRNAAVSATLLCRAATLWFAVLLGVLAMLDAQRRSPFPKAVPSSSASL